MDDQPAAGAVPGESVSGEFVTEQHLLVDYASERAMLQAVMTLTRERARNRDLALTLRCPRANTSRQGSEKVGFSGWSPVISSKRRSDIAYTTRPILHQ